MHARSAGHSFKVEHMHCALVQSLESLLRIKIRIILAAGTSNLYDSDITYQRSNDYPLGNIKEWPFNENEENYWAPHFMS